MFDEYEYQDRELEWDLDHPAPGTYDVYSGHMVPKTSEPEE
jgi:hypothetical protein